MHRMSRWFLIGLLQFGFATAHADESVEDALAKARAELDRAAAALAKAYTKASAHDPHKKSDRAMLGVLLDDNGDEFGLRITGVTPGGGAAEAGLLAGDRLVKVDDMQLVQEGKTPMHVLSNFMKGVKPGEAVRVEYVRDGDASVLDVVTRANGHHRLRELKSEVIEVHGGDGQLHTQVYAPESLLDATPFVDVAGDLADYFDVDSGVLAFRLPESVSEMREGDIVVEIAGKAVLNSAQVNKRLGWLDEPVEVGVKRKGRKRNVMVKPGEFSTATPEVRVIRMHKQGPPPAPNPP